MTNTPCALSGPAVQWPDVGNGDVPCCHGSGMFGPERCTCWTPVFDLDQVAPVLPQDPKARADKCHDCAYRPDSPERSGHEDAGADHDELLRLARTGQVFWCHQGMRRPLYWVHPYGAQLPASELNYQPPMREQDGQVVPYKADGTPADICGGWAAIRQSEGRSG